jgi:hypothetical protein
VKELVREGLAAFLHYRPPIDGRSLHEYEATDEELVALRLYLHGREPKEWHAREHAIVVLLLAEWAHRNARSASVVIKNATSALGVQPGRAELRESLVVGMKAWKLPADERTDAQWNSTLLAEGGYPVRFSREALATLVERVGHAFSWPELLRVNEDAVVRHLTSEAPRFPSLLGTEDDVWFFTELFRKFADYCRVLAMMFELVPGRHEKPEHWVSRIKPLASPELWLPFRTKLDPVFVEAFFPQLQRVNKVGWNLGSSLHRPAPVPCTTAREAPSSLTLGARIVEPELQLFNTIRARSAPGRPLYTYRLSDEEFQALRAEVATDVRLRRQLHGHRAARFCLFAANELCRTYVGGAWKWEPVQDALGWKPSPKEREDAVRAGMSYWQRPIHQVGNSQRLLMTLFMEGGLPLAALAEGRELHLRQFFRALIAQAERYQTSARQFIQDQIQLLPATFRTNEGVQNLSAELADTIVALRKKLPNPVADAVAYLDASEPGWANNLPLQVDPATAREFLGGLLATQEPKATRFLDPVEVETWLYDAPVRLERRARVQDEIPVRDIAQFLNVSEEAIRQRSRFSLSMATVTGERHNVAVLRLSEDETMFRAEPPPVSPVRDPRAAHGQIRIVANAGDTDIANVDVPGGEPLLEDVPWIFEGGTNNRARLLAQGNVHHRGAEVVALFPTDGAPTQAPPGALVRSGKVYQGREIVTVRGDVSWTALGESWSISTSGEAIERRFALVGATSRCGFTGSDFWDGAPSISAVDADGRRTIVPDSRIEARIHGTREWRPFRTVSGEIDVRIREDGETVFRTTIVALPTGTRIKLDTPRNSVLVRCPGLVAARLNGERIEARAGECAVPYRPGTVLETSSVLALDLGTKGRCTISVPAPIRAVQFVGREGPVTGPIVLDRLGQIRAQAVAPTNEKFQIEARIQGELSWRPIAQLHSADTASGVSELGLGAVREKIEDFFAASRGLDTKVELKITSPTTPRSPTLVVRRYEEKPEWRRVDNNTLEVSLADEAVQRIGEMGMQLLEMNLRPLHDPSQPTRPVTRVANARWEIPTTTLRDAASWLVTGTIRGRVRLRPVLFPTPGYRSPQDEPSALRTLMAEPMKNLRREGLAKLVPELCADWSRREWNEIAQLLMSIDDLPPATFDIIPALAEVPEATCAALFRCGGDLESFRRIWRGFEKLPFLWGSVPVEAWTSSARHLKAWVQAMCESTGLEPGSLERQLLAPLLQHFTPLCKVVEEAFGWSGLPVSKPASSCLSITVAEFVERLRPAIHALNARHYNEWWPSDSNLLELRFESDVSAVEPLISNALGELGRTYRRWVLRAPMQLGLAAGFNIRLSPSTLLAARTIRTFDPVWFEDAHALAFQLAARMQLRGSK